MNVDLNNSTIIVVEDDPNSYLAALDLLKMEGATSVHCCNSGQNAIALAETLPKVDLFLVDIYMPGETGYDIIKQIRTHPRLAPSKVVALTASVMYDDIRRVKEAGFDSFIGKPVRPARFANQVRQILAGETLWEWR
jgi:two-component system, cell cycle response regulator DivK